MIDQSIDHCIAYLLTTRRHNTGIKNWLGVVAFFGASSGVICLLRLLVQEISETMAYDYGKRQRMDGNNYGMAPPPKRVCEMLLKLVA